MTTACITQVFDNASSLQAAGRAHRQDTFHISSASLTLCAEAALTPQYGLTYNTLGSIVGRLHLLILHKCPQILFMFKDVTALTAQIAIKPRTGFKQRFNTFLKFWHSALKRWPLQRTVTDSFSQFQDFLCQIMKPVAYFANRAFGLAYRRETPLQMRPAYLANQCVKFVGVIAITYQFARKIAYQATSRLLAAIGMNHKKCRCGTAQCPQPAFETITSGPAGFIRMCRFLSSDMLSGFIIRL